MQRRNTDPDQARRNARADRASPSTASVGSASSASKNTNRAHDASALTSRLKHLDDCMRQVKSLMKNLEKSEDPRAQEELFRLQRLYSDLADKSASMQSLLDQMAQQQLLTLHQMLDQLNIEHANTDDRKGRFNALDLRQRHLNERLIETGGREASPASASGSLDNCLNCDPSDDPQYAQLLQDEKESLMEQNAVIRKIIESQKKLSALREQHDIIRSVQKKAENKLAEAKAFQDQLAASNPDLSVWVSEMQRETAAGTLPMPPTSALRESKRAAPSRRAHHGASAPPSDATCCGDGNWNWPADSAADGASAEALIGAIGGHPAGDVEFEQLERRVQQLQNLIARQDKIGIADLESPVADSDSTDLQTSQISANIQALQEQKSQVDQLLRELSTLQTEACRLGIQSNLSAGNANEGSKGDSSTRGSTKFSTPYEQASMRDKKRQVSEMRKTLQQLKSAVKNLDHGGSSGAVGNSSSALPEAQPKSRGSGAYKKDNLHGDFPARRHYEAEGRANEEPDVGPGAATAATVSAQPSIDPSSTAQARASGDMLAEKVRQLQTTRSQLQYLQSLVSSLLDGSAEPAVSAQRSSVPSSGESDLRKEQQKQRHNLEQLQEQRLRLSLLRQQLASTQPPLAKNQLRVAPEGPQHLLPPAASPRGATADANPVLSPTKKDNVTLPKNLYDTTKASNRLHENSSNLESLNRDKAILEELLQQERSKQLLSYSHNEDVRSPSSCSASSEPMEGMNFGTGSVMAGGNTTIAATWGGSSTQENLEDEDDEEDRQEGSVEAGHDSEGSRSDIENDTGRSVPPPLAGKDHHHATTEPTALPAGRADNRLTNTHSSRVNGPYSGGGQWHGQWHSATGVINTPLQRQHSSGPQGDPSQVLPEVEGLQSMPGVSGLPAVPGFHQLSQHLLQQLEHTNAMYQSILQEQQAFGTSAATAMSPGPQFRVSNPDVLHHYAIQQQLLLSIIHCYQLLSIQQMEISQLQQATHQQSCSPSLDDGLRGPILQPLDQGSPFLTEPDPAAGTWAQGVAAAALHAAGPQAHRPLATADARGAPPGATLNNQVVPGSRANNFWDNFRSYSRQNLLSNPGTVPKTNELPANFQVQQSHPSGPLLTAASSRTKVWAFPRDSRDCPPTFASASSFSQPSHVRPVQNVWPQESPGNRMNDTKQANGTQGHASGAEHTAEALNISPRRPASQQQQQPACDVLKMSIGAEVSRLLEGKEDAASLAAVLHQLQLLNSPQPDLTRGQACGGARRKVPLSAKSNIPKENRAQDGDRHLMFQRGTSESSPDLVASVEFATDSRSRIEETLSDSSFDKNISRPLAAVTARKRAKPLCSPASQPPQLSAMAAASMERSAPAEHMVAERDCGSNEDQAASARPIEPVFEQTWPEKDTTVSAPQGAEMPQPGGEGPVGEPLPGLDNMLMMAEAHALRGVNQDVQQAMYNIELAFLQQGLAPGGEQQGEEAEDDEDRELETEPEAEGTQDLAEADQSPAAEQDASDQQPEDVAAPALLGAVGGAVGGAEGGAAEQSMDDAASRQALSDAPEVPHEDALPRTESEDSPSRQHEGSQPPPS